MQGGERIELPPMVLETTVMPLDQSPLINLSYLQRQNNHLVYYARWLFCRLLHQER